MAVRARPCVFVLSKIPGLYVNVKQQMKDVEVINSEFGNGNQKLTKEEISTLDDATVLLADPDLGAQVIGKLPNLKWIQCTWAGVEPMIDKIKENPTCTVTRMGGVFGAQMAEYVIGHIIARERKFHLTWEQQNTSSWRQAALSNYRLLDTLSIGILGTGDIGREVAKACKTFGMKVWGLVRRIPLEEERPRYVDEFRLQDGLEEILKSCDYICNVLPHTKGTAGLLDHGVLKNCMKKKSVFINIGRGGVVSDDDLLEALDKGWIAGAMLDVFNTEPLPEDSRLWRLPNVVITPHVAAISFDYQVADLFAENYERFCSSKPLKYPVDWNSGY